MRVYLLSAVSRIQPSQVIKFKSIMYVLGDKQENSIMLAASITTIGADLDTFTIADMVA
jgi:hypothetical protein